MYRIAPSRSRGRSLVGAGVIVAAATAFLVGPADAAPRTDSQLEEEPFSRLFGYPGEEPFSHPCFSVQVHWNEALHGPQPLCPVPRRDQAERTIEPPLDDWKRLLDQIGTPLASTASREVPRTDA